MSLFHLNIVTPEGQFFSDDVKKVVLRGSEGDFAILKNRAPLITTLKIGIIKVFKDDEVIFHAALGDGYVSVDGLYTTVVTKRAEWPYEIDVNKAIEDKKRAEEQLRDKGKDVVHAQIALRRALTRIEVSKHDWLDH